MSSTSVAEPRLHWKYRPGTKRIRYSCPWNVLLRNAGGCAYHKYLTLSQQSPVVFDNNARCKLEVNDEAASELGRPRKPYY